MYREKIICKEFAAKLRGRGGRGEGVKGRWGEWEKGGVNLFFIEEI